MGRPFSTFNVPLGTRLVSSHVRSGDEGAELTEEEKWERLRREVLDLEEKPFIEQQEPPEDWAL